MSDKLPALHFYVQDYLADTRSLSNELKGFYVDLLCYMHKSSRRGYLQQASGNPYSPQQLGAMTGCTADEASRLYAELIACKVISATPKGIAYSRRMVRDEQKRLIGKKFAKVRWEPDPMGHPMGVPMGKCEDEIEDERVKEKGGGAGGGKGKSPGISGAKEFFNEARKAYPGTKLGLETEWGNFQKKNPDYRDILPLLLPAINAEIEHKKQLANTPGAFRPEWAHLATWINQKRWTQEFEQIGASNGTNQQHRQQFESPSQRNLRKLKQNLGITGEETIDSESSGFLLPVLPPRTAGG